MSVLGHVAIGVVVARRSTPSDAPSELTATRMIWLAALALLPDSDLVIHEFLPDVSAFDHRGATHSLAVAVVVGILVGLALAAAQAEHPVRWAIIAALVVASHGLMDTIGDSSLGVQLLWPFSDARILAPWHLLPDPSLERPFLTNVYGKLAMEAVLFLPAWLYAFWPRSRWPWSRKERA